MLSIQFADTVLNLDGSPPLDAALLENAARQVLESVQPGSQAALTLLVSDDAQLHDLNRQYLDSDTPTDVLSFPAGDTDPDLGEVYLGDVVISLERAQAQAQTGGHSLAAEVQLLAVHGILHLLGYDHATPEEKAEMWRIQAQILADLGCSVTIPTE